MIAIPASAWSAGDPASPEEAKSEIARVSKEIAELKSMMLSRSDERASLQIALRETDKEIATANQSIKQSTQNIKALNRAINDLEAEASTLQRDIAAKQSQLENAIGVFSVLRQGGDLKILFGDSNAMESERHRAYFKLLVSEQLKAIDAFKAAITALDANQKQQKTTRKAQKNELAQLEARRADMLATRTDQKNIITRLTRLLSQDDQQIQALKEDAARLKTLLTELTRRLSDLNLVDEVADFATLSGKLQTPVKGLSKTRFGQKRDRGDLRWQGWLVPAQRGTAVRAIHSGRVIFADWLRGQGLLTIIDHGDGWMSLYGRNESLLKDTGEWVSPGEQIATVGSSGGAKNPALYFEIRANGIPVDPAKWIR